MLADRVAGVLLAFDLSARLLVAGIVGLATVLAVDVAPRLVVPDEMSVEALFLAAGTLATAGPNEAFADAQG